MKREVLLPEEVQPADSGSGPIAFWRSEFLKVGLLAIGALLVCEAALRVRAARRYGQVRATYILDDPVLRQTLKPNFRTTGTLGSVTINEHGFRGASFPEKPAPGVVRIACVGSSPVFGGTMNDELIFPTVLEKLLNRGPGSRRVEVINAGVPGLSSRHLLEHLRHRILPYAPRIALIYAASNDIGVAVRDATMSEASDGQALHFLQTWRQRTSVLYHTCRDVFSLIRPDTAGAQFKSFPAEAAGTLRENYRALVRFCRRKGIVPVLLTEAYAFRRDQPLSEQWKLLGGSGWGLGLEGSHQAHETLNEAVRRVAEEEGVLLIDLARMVPGGPQYFMDGLHFTPKGHRFVARTLARELVRHGVIERAANREG